MPLIINKGICHISFMASDAYLRIEVSRDVVWYKYFEGTKNLFRLVGEKEDKMEDWFQCHIDK